VAGEAIEWSISDRQLVMAKSPKLKIEMKAATPRSAGFASQNRFSVRIADE